MSEFFTFSDEGKNGDRRFKNVMIEFAKGFQLVEGEGEGVWTPPIMADIVCVSILLIITL